MVFLTQSNRLVFNVFHSDTMFEDTETDCQMFAYVSDITILIS